MVIRSCLVIVFMVLMQQTFSQRPIQRTASSVGLISFQNRTKPENKNFGTGTLIAKVISEHEGFIFLVTNRHCLPSYSQSDSVHFFLRNSNSQKPAFFDIKILIHEKNGTLTKNIKFDPDGNDLAVVNLSEFFMKMPELQYLTSAMFTTSFFINRDSIISQDIEIGDEILFIGYPNALFDKRNFSPLVRTGIIASSPTDDYYFSDIYRKSFFAKSGEMIPERLSGFLIDGNVFSGSSGSLVFTKPRYFKLTANGPPKYSSSPDGHIGVLGVLTNSYFDVGSIVGDRLQLGGVISTSQILKTMNLFSKERDPYYK